MVGVWNDFQRHIFWKIGDGRHTNFWLDKWVPNRSELFPSASQNFIDTTISVRDVLNTEGDWSLSFLRENLPTNIVNQVVALPTPIDVDGTDVMGWEGTNTYRFTIQSAYRLQHGDIHALEGDWNSLWDWKGPHRIQTFIWLAAQECILTNFRRSKWGAGISPLCSRCGREDETTIHVLRDCDYAIQVWLRLVLSYFITDFFTFDCRDWIFNNLGKRGICATTKNWKTIFMTSCWFLWTWRNKAIFENDFHQPNNPVMVIQNFTKQIDFFVGGENSGCGGLFRCSDGRWLKGYIKKVGVCDVLHAELWGMYLGLDMAWREHIPRLIVESNSKTLIDMVTGSCMFSGVIPTLVRCIRNLLTLDWHVSFVILGGMIIVVLIGWRPLVFL